MFNYYNEKRLFCQPPFLCSKHLYYPVFSQNHRIAAKATTMDFLLSVSNKVALHTSQVTSSLASLKPESCKEVGRVEDYNLKPKQEVVEGTEQTTTLIKKPGF